ncbi:hypothetical protein CIB48_g1200 [Xylaria polymorpha]|nr:hypothetical protein CIB48_g1200 [Xylaria polymorpha]
MTLVATRDLIAPSVLEAQATLGFYYVNWFLNLILPSPPLTEVLVEQHGREKTREKQASEFLGLGTELQYSTAPTPVTMGLAGGALGMSSYPGLGLGLVLDEYINLSTVGTIEACYLSTIPTVHILRFLAEPPRPTLPRVAAPSERDRLDTHPGEHSTAQSRDFLQTRATSALALPLPPFPDRFYIHPSPSFASPIRKRKGTTHFRNRSPVIPGPAKPRPFARLSTSGNPRLVSHPGLLPAKHTRSRRRLFPVPPFPRSPVRSPGVCVLVDDPHARQDARMSGSQFPPPLSYSSGQGAIATSIHSPPGILSPDSANSIYASPDSGHQPFYLAKSEPDDGASTGSSAAAGPSSHEPLKKKQKRNKPTLSCHECVERKTKALNVRMCGIEMVACVAGDMMGIDVTTLPALETTRSATNGRRMTKPPKKKLSASGIKPTLPNIADRGILTGDTATPSNVFGIGSEHPFANYWTCEGGLPEVIGVLPEKLQADILLSQYFECVDPVYPMIHSQSFYAEYERFWMLKVSGQTDASFVALLFVMLALGTQFVSTTNPQDRKQTAEFYASAGNQALRMSSYLSTASIHSVQAMVLLCYFLINDNHASDGWAFAGILMRQAYAMGLHRDPNIVTPEASPFEKQQRRKLWQAVLLQDTFLTVLLSLPPSATHTDVKIDDFADHSYNVAHADPTDTAYIKGSWMLANLVQETICSPRSLDLPICSTQRQKSKLVADFRSVYRSFPDIFRSWDQDSISQLATSNKRIVRQTLFLSSNYYHNLMLVHASESPDVPVNIRGTLEAAHEAITAFFVLFTLFDTEARVWWVFNHRAFLEALCIGGVLREAARDPATADQMARDPLFSKAKADITRMIQIMKIMSDGDLGSDAARTRVSVLSEYL